jgi:hypothetical protein
MLALSRTSTSSTTAHTVLLHNGTRLTSCLKAIVRVCVVCVHDATQCSPWQSNDDALQQVYYDRDSDTHLWSKQVLCEVFWTQLYLFKVTRCYSAYHLIPVVQCHTTCNAQSIPMRSVIAISVTAISGTNATDCCCY